MNGIKIPNFAFRCPKCQEEVAYVLSTHKCECSTPVGKIKTASYDAWCKRCNTQLKSLELSVFNQILVILATMGAWRQLNPEGTKKQCHKALGLNKSTVDKLWDICLAEFEETEERKKEEENDE